MVWTTPPTFTPSQVVDEDDMNAISDDLDWLHAKPIVRVYNSGAQSIPNNTATALTFNTEDIDTHAMHSTSSNTSRLTVPSGYGGKWFCHGQAEYATNATGIRENRIRLNGTTYKISAIRDTVVTASAVTTVEVAGLLELAAADYLELMTRQTSGGALNADNGLDVTFFEMAFIGA